MRSFAEELLCQPAAITGSTFAADNLHAADAIRSLRYGNDLYGDVSLWADEFASNQRAPSVCGYRLSTYFPSASSRHDRIGRWLWWLRRLPLELFVLRFQLVDQFLLIGD